RGFGLQGKHVRRNAVFVLTNLFGLVQVPLVGSLGLLQHSLSMGAMPKDGDHCDENCKDADGERDIGQARLAALFNLLAKFVDFGRFHGVILPVGRRKPAHIFRKSADPKKSHISMSISGLSAMNSAAALLTARFDSGEL